MTPIEISDEESCRGGDIPSCAKAGAAFTAVRDQARASAMFEKGCSLGDKESCYRSAEIVETGSQKNVPVAMAAFEKLCKEEHTRSCVHLGAIYKEARNGIARDDARAISFYERACGLRNQAGCTVLSSFLLNGDGIKKDAVRARQLLSVAAASGHSGAQVLLGQVYFNGIGVAADADQATAWFRKACDQDDPSACEFLGSALIAANANKIDPEGIVFLKKACGLGQRDSCSLLEKIGSYEKRESAIEASAVWRAYDENELAADERFKGKRFIVRGTIQAVTKDVAGVAVIQLKSPNGYLPVMVYLKDDQITKAMKLRKGEEVVASCVGDGAIMGAPTLNECEL